MKRRRIFTWIACSFFLNVFFWPATFPRTPPPKAPVIRPVVNRDYLPTILKMIAEAQKTIDFIQLEFHYDPTVKQIQDSLREALKRGVKVRGLLEDGIKFNQTSKDYLNRYGIETKLDTPKKMLHNKLFIVDGAKVLLGATNLSSNSINNNNETNVYVEDSRLGAFFENYFEQLWKDSYSEPAIETLNLPGIQTVLNRQHFDVLFQLLNSAQEKIWVMMYGMKYYERYPDSKTNRLIDSLIAAYKRGVDVKVILDKSDYNRILNQINEATKKHLERGGVPVSYDQEAVTTHAKLVIADDRALVGSANWGYDALERRNESSLLISDPETVLFFEKYFLKIWEEGAAGQKTDRMNSSVLSPDGT